MSQHLQQTLKNPMYIRIKWNFESTMFELNMPDLYIDIM